MESVQNPEQPTAVICQFARMGDLAQTLPLINQIAGRYRLRLFCDRSVESWAKTIPVVTEVVSLDTREWRRRCLTPAELFFRSLHDLDGGLRTWMPDDLSPVFALNDHPVSDALLGWICFARPERWLTRRLMLVRSYIRMIAGRRRLNRIHLADLWASFAMEDGKSARIPSSIRQMGTRFANSVWEEWKRRKSRRIWGMILGSGAKSRRLEPEDFARIWSGIPETIRPALVLIGGPGEEPLSEKFLRFVPSSNSDILKLLGRSSPEELIAVLMDLEYVIGVDTGPLHWAAAVGTKVLGFYFAEAGFHDTGPYGEGHLVLAPECPEYPCHPRRAELCGRLCRNAFLNAGGFASFLSRLVQNGDVVWNQPPKNLRIYRSTLREGWNRFESAQDDAQDETAEGFADYVKKILRETPQKERNAPNRSVAWLRQLWRDEVLSLSFPRSVLDEIVDRVKREAISTLTSEVDITTAYENLTPERRLLSVEPAQVGA